MNFVSEYIKYLLNAKGRHGIHSPFVYDFADTCLRIKPDAECMAAMNVLRNTLSADHTLVEVADFGAGSRKLGKSRTVREIFKTASCKGVYARLLYQLSSHYRPKNILELGTSLGVGTIHLATDASQRVTTVDACANTLAVAEKNIKAAGLDNVMLVNATFADFLDGLNQDAHFDLVYIDGHHDGEALLGYMNKLNSFTDENTLFVLDDIRWSDGMFSAWKTLAASGEFHLSMDLFRMGILVRRPGQVKEHFVIRLRNVLSGF